MPIIGVILHCLPTGFIRALSEEFNLGMGIGLKFKYIYEGMANDLSLFFRIRNSFQVTVEFFLRIHTLDPQSELLINQEYFFELVFAQEAVVDKKAE